MYFEGIWVNTLGVTECILWACPGKYRCVTKTTRFGTNTIFIPDKNASPVFKSLASFQVAVLASDKDIRFNSVKIGTLPVRHGSQMR